MKRIKKLDELATELEIIKEVGVWDKYLNNKLTEMYDSDITNAARGEFYFTKGMQSLLDIGYPKPVIQHYTNLYNKIVQDTGIDKYGFDNNKRRNPFSHGEYTPRPGSGNLN